MFIEFSDTIMNFNLIMVIFKHEENDKFLVCVKPEGKEYKAIAESFDTEIERDKRFNQIRNKLKITK